MSLTPLGMYYDTFSFLRISACSLINFLTLTRYSQKFLSQCQN